MTGVTVGLAALALVAAWLLMAWHGLVAARNRAEDTWGAIDEHLALRHALVPELHDLVRAELPEETEVLSRLAGARDAALTAASPFDRADAERRLVAGLGAAAALVERHPSLGADATFVDLQARLAGIEDGLRSARRIYNADVRLYLSRRRRFPRALLSRAGGFPDRPYYELDHTRERGAGFVLAA